MVALALIDQGMKPELAIKMLRDARPGALNLQQTNFVFKYGNTKSNNACCTVF